MGNGQPKKFICPFPKHSPIYFLQTFMKLSKLYINDHERIIEKHSIDLILKYVV